MKSRRGALLATMEHRCIAPGMWLVEGHRVECRGSAQRWWIVDWVGRDDRRPDYLTMTDALEALADELNQEKGWPE